MKITEQKLSSNRNDKKAHRIHAVFPSQDVISSKSFLRAFSVPAGKMEKKKKNNNNASVFRFEREKSLANDFNEFRWGARADERRYEKISAKCGRVVRIKMVITI